MYNVSIRLGGVKMKYELNQEIRFRDSKGEIHKGSILRIRLFKGVRYYKVLVGDFWYEITEKEIIGL